MVNSTHITKASLNNKLRDTVECNRWIVSIRHKEIEKHFIGNGTAKVAIQEVWCHMLRART
jgi:hypothetical protein